MAHRRRRSFERELKKQQKAFARSAREYAKLIQRERGREKDSVEFEPVVRYYDAPQPQSTPGGAAEPAAWYPHQQGGAGTLQLPSADETKALLEKTRRELQASMRSMEERIRECCLNKDELKQLFALRMNALHTKIDGLWNSDRWQEEKARLAGHMQSSRLTPENVFESNEWLQGQRVLRDLVAMINDLRLGVGQGVMVLGPHLDSMAVVLRNLVLRLGENRNDHEFQINEVRNAIRHLEGIIQDSNPNPALDEIRNKLNELRDIVQRLTSSAGGNGGRGGLRGSGRGSEWSGWNGGRNGSSGARWQRLGSNWLRHNEDNMSFGVGGGLGLGQRDGSSGGSEGGGGGRGQQEDNAGSDRSSHNEENTSSGGGGGLGFGGNDRSSGGSEGRGGGRGQQENNEGGSNRSRHNGDNINSGRGSGSGLSGVGNGMSGARGQREGSRRSSYGNENRMYVGGSGGRGQVENNGVYNSAGNSQRPSQRELASEDIYSRLSALQDKQRNFYEEIEPMRNLAWLLGPKETPRFFLSSFVAQRATRKVYEMETRLDRLDADVQTVRERFWEYFGARGDPPLSAIAVNAEEWLVTFEARSKQTRELIKKLYIITTHLPNITKAFASLNTRGLPTDHYKDLYVAIQTELDSNEESSIHRLLDLIKVHISRMQDLVRNHEAPRTESQGRPDPTSTLFFPVSSGNSSLTPNQARQNEKEAFMRHMLELFEAAFPQRAPKNNTVDIFWEMFDRSKNEVSDVIDNTNEYTTMERMSEIRRCRKDVEAMLFRHALGDIEKGIGTVLVRTKAACGHLLNILSSSIFEDRLNGRNRIFGRAAAHWRKTLHGLKNLYEKVVSSSNARNDHRAVFAAYIAGLGTSLSRRIAENNTGNNAPQAGRIVLSDNNYTPSNHSRHARSEHASPYHNIVTRPWQEDTRRTVEDEIDRRHTTPYNVEENRHLYWKYGKAVNRALEPRRLHLGGHRTHAVVEAQKLCKQLFVQHLRKHLQGRADAESVYGVARSAVLAYAIEMHYLRLEHAIPEEDVRQRVTNMRRNKPSVTPGTIRQEILAAILKLRQATRAYIVDDVVDYMVTKIFHALNDRFHKGVASAILVSYMETEREIAEGSLRALYAGTKPWVINRSTFIYIFRCIDASAAELQADKYAHSAWELCIKNLFDKMDAPLGHSAVLKNVQIQLHESRERRFEGLWKREVEQIAKMLSLSDSRGTENRGSEINKRFIGIIESAMSEYRSTNKNMEEADDKIMAVDRDQEVEIKKAQSDWMETGAIGNAVESTIVWFGSRLRLDIEKLNATPQNVSRLLHIEKQDGVGKVQCILPSLMKKLKGHAVAIAECGAKRREWARGSATPSSSASGNRVPTYETPSTGDSTAGSVTRTVNATPARLRFSP